ncbi:hypothetical protein BEWA_016290 [Theileria equi strain WA]|uniref:Uncharacterized protein n=1 Tax=Theileria equi strain WA TaxID=1537102 RepID=L1LD14_THEEQ|nr:hypothetical protein BEWA_016290 [Theileria equi strain WA]EKX73068.1 hypothetical protein BEWA_016290 [Theileria equi strain WA]|eukprot:XP_004832520.1 hypothetical protein BEWA_016290 [Theileria equi strain WA]
MDHVDAIRLAVFLPEKRGTFTLKGHLQNGDKLNEEGTGISGVTKVSVYYWDKDRECRKPLLMEVYVGDVDLKGIPISLENDGYPDNKKWTMILGQGGGYQLSPETLHKYKCKLFRPAIIDVSQTGVSYANKYCEGKKCTNGNCPDEVMVTDYKEVKLENYKAKAHTYGKDNKTFTITGFRNGLSLQELTPPLWNVTELVVFFASCSNSNDPATSKPLLVYVSSDSGKDHRWYSRTGKDKTAYEWKEEEDRLGGKDPKAASSNGTLQSILEEIKEKLQLSCKEEKKEVEIQQELRSEENTVEPGQKAKAKVQPQQPPVPPPVPPLPHGTSDSNPPEIIKTTISVTTGFLGTSALACFAGWKLYNRYNGDPWVRQI